MVIIVPMWLLGWVGPILAVVLAWYLQNRRLRVIHDNTNSQLATALEKIQELQQEIRELKAVRR